MRPRRWATALPLAAALILLVPAQADLFSPNPWTARARLNIAHQGGALEAPSNTLFAFKTALRAGAEVLELDVHATSDRQLVVIHDTTVDRTTDGAGRVDAMTLEQIKRLDAAYWFVPGEGPVRDRPGSDYIYRGIATGDRKPPPRYEPNDFTIPTLREVLETFPGTWINIEIKRTVPETAPYEQELAALLAEFGRIDDVIVVSFHDHALEAFKVFAPQVSTATGTAETAAFWGSSQRQLPGAPNPRYQALQVPIFFEGVEVVNADFVSNANANGLAVHVWTINDRETMEFLLEIGVQGIMTDRPQLLESVLEGTKPPRQKRAPSNPRARPPSP